MPEVQPRGVGRVASGDRPSIWDVLGIKPESLSRIRFGTGVLGRIVFVTVAGLIVLGLAVSRLSDPAAILIVTGLAALVVLAAVVGGLIFAFRHPGAAILEGTELVQWQEVNAGAKGLQIPANSPLIPDPLTIQGQATVVARKAVGSGGTDA